MTIDFTGTAAPELASCLSAYLFCLLVVNRAESRRGRESRARSAATAVPDGLPTQWTDTRFGPESLFGHAVSTKYKGLH
ncbi:hypothetical protein NUV26_02105 [Burkholderia pseudomultivorans]|uniref:hypothetical protein n=1 Tax=Burkholderia pseudomultivorans TaxID=1207504 RepID=UPI0012DA3DA7|nr:hypothetical protein [Burkholderia pseudomultivorans]MDS0790931.1 hypothetical protein [Burkholderia pseudomultivorans]